MDQLGDQTHPSEGGRPRWSRVLFAPPPKPIQVSFFLTVALAGLGLVVFTWLDIRDLRTRFPKEQDFRAMGHAMMLLLGFTVWLVSLVRATVAQLAKPGERGTQLRWLAVANLCVLVVLWVALVWTVTGWLA